MKINLHAHTNHSIDSSKSVESYLMELEENGVNLASITDHNSVDAYFEIEQSDLRSLFGGELVIGTELDVRQGDYNFDVTCYGFDLDKMKQMLDGVYGSIAECNLARYNEILQVAEEKGFVVDYNYKYENPSQLYAYGAAYENLFSNPYNREKLGERLPKTYGEFFRLITTDKTFPLYYQTTAARPALSDVVEFVHSIGGKVFLAHPFEYYSDESTFGILEEVKDLVDGVEVFNSNVTSKQIQILKDYVNEHDMLISGGTDYHYPKRAKIMLPKMDEQDAEKIASWASACPSNQAQPQ